MSGEALTAPAGKSRPGAAFWALAAVLWAVPLALAPGLLLFDVTPKVLALLVGTCLVWMALAAEGRLPDFRDRRQAWFFLLLAALAMAATLATVFSRDPVLSLVGSEWRRMGLPAWLASLALAAAVPLAVGEDRCRRRRLVAALALAAVAATVYSFLQYLDWDPWIPSLLYRTGEGQQSIVRPPATLGHANYFAAFALLGTFGAAGLAVSASRRSARVVWGAAAVVLVLGLVVSGSRGAWLGAAAGVAVLVLASTSAGRALLAGLLAVTALAAVFIISPAGQAVRNRLLSFMADPGAPARLPLWRDSLRLARAHLLLGTGPDTFQVSFPAFESLDMAQRAPDHYVESPHNVFLDYLTAAGLPAALAFALLMGTALWNFAASGRAGAADAPLDVALLSGLVAGLVASQFIGETIATRLALLVWAALSFTARFENQRMVAGLAPRLAVAGIALAFLAPVLLLGARLARADRAGLEAADAVAFGDLAKARRAERRAREAFPWTGTYAFAYSRALGMFLMKRDLSPAQRGLLVADAEEAARAALAHSTKPQAIHVHLASLHVLQGRKAEAQAALKVAMEAAPAWYRPRWLLALLLSDQGRHGEAAEQAAAALERGARTHPEIAASCFEIRRRANL